MDPFAEHAARCGRLSSALAAAKARGAAVRLGKSTSNLFRRRDRRGTVRLDVRDFNHVLRIDKLRLLADVEGMTTYETLVEETLRDGLLPAVVPQLKTITVGGAVSGVGIESSSFRFGLVHETVEEMDILLSDGSVVTCSPGEHRDLFFGFPNSYGTLGYALRLRVRLVRARPYVHLTHTRFSEPGCYFAHIREICAGGGVNYVDGVIFGENEMYVTAGEFTEEAPRVSDYTYMRQYYRSIQARKHDWLTARAYIWRWDTDWFWCSKQFGAQNAAVRLLATKWLLNSRTYQRLMRLSQVLLPAWKGTESVIQDVDIPIENAAAFGNFLLAEIGITPVWICPLRSPDPAVTYDLYPLDRRKLYINFGFWDTVKTGREDGYLNRKVEQKALELRGKKGLYSTAYYDPETFWTIYNGARYAELKSRYDAAGVFPDLYAKCVRRQ